MTEQQRNFNPDRAAMDAVSRIQDVFGTGYLDRFDAQRFAKIQDIIGDVIRAALSHAEGEAGWRSGYPEYDGDGGVCHIPLDGHPDFMVVAFNSDGNLVDSCGDDVGYSLEDVERWKPIDAPTAPQVAVPEGWTDRHTRVTRFALWRLINEGYYRANVAAQKGQPGTADDAAALLDDVERAEEARNMLAARLRAGKEGE